MEQLEPDNILKSLDAMSEQIGKVEDLVSNGEDLAALQMLSAIKKSIRQVVVTILCCACRKILRVSAAKINSLTKCAYVIFLSS